MSRAPKLDNKTQELLGLKSKDWPVYLALLQLGTAPLRRIAEEAGLNRGTTYDALKRLIELKLASYVDAKSHRYFTAEDPSRLRGLATRREVAIQEARQEISSLLPELQTLLGASTHRPVVRYYEGDSGIRSILEDVLQVAEQTESNMYRIYSSAGRISDLILAAWPKFTSTRIKRGINVRAIAIGGGGSTAGLDERRWLRKDVESPTYIFLYEGKTAYISIDNQNKLFGVIIEGEAIAATQKMVFEMMWKFLA